jgi:hypothetical protein
MSRSREGPDSFGRQRRGGQCLLILLIIYNIFLVYDYFTIGKLRGQIFWFSRPRSPQSESTSLEASLHAMVKANRTASRPPNKSKLGSGKPRPSGSKANAAGYAKRHSNKAKTAHGIQSSDVYEYAPELSRRSKVTLDLDHDEAAEYGVGIDGDNDEERDALRARLIGENGENEMIESGDDEEVDSDAAFEESDEDRFAGFFSSKVWLS